jgi:hypothetical protein
LKGNSIELLNNIASSVSASTKLHFQIRLKAKDFKTSRDLHDAAEKIVSLTRSAHFSSTLIDELKSVAIVQDKGTIDRFGWLFATDVELLSAVALPIGDNRDPYSLEPPSATGSSGDSNQNRDLIDFILLGIALGALCGMVLLMCVHCRLRNEYDLMSKDKSSLAKTSESLQRLWTTIVKKNSKSSKETELASLSREKLEEELRLAQSGLMQSVDSDGDDDKDLHN